MLNVDKLCITINATLFQKYSCSVLHFALHLRKLSLMTLLQFRIFEAVIITGVVVALVWMIIHEHNRDLAIKKQNQKITNMSKLTKELFLAGARFRENFTTLQSSYAYIPPSTGARYSYGRIDRYLSGKDQYECSVIDVDDKGFKISTNVVGHPVTVHRPFTDFILIEKEAPVEPA